MMFKNEKVSFGQSETFKRLAFSEIAPPSVHGYSPQKTLFCRVSADTRILRIEVEGRW